MTIEKIKELILSDSTLISWGFNFVDFISVLDSGAAGSSFDLKLKNEFCVITFNINPFFRNNTSVSLYISNGSSVLSVFRLLRNIGYNQLVDRFSWNISAIEQADLSGFEKAIDEVINIEQIREILTGEIKLDAYSTIRD